MAADLPKEAWLLHQLRLFFTALQFFTRLPVPHWVGFQEEWLHHTARFFPLTGWLVGAIVAAVAWGAGLILPQSVALLLSMACGIYLTGAMHEDGFADMCDGFGGAVQRERILEIMKDSRIGVFGAIGIGILLATRFAALNSLPRWQIPLVLLASHPISRLFATSLMWRFDYVRAEGKAAPVAHRMAGGEFLFATLCGLLPLLMFVGGGWLAWLPALTGFWLATVATAFLAHMFVRRIGGYTGDCLGAVQQMSEVAFYLGMLIFLT